MMQRRHLLALSGLLLARPGMADTLHERLASGRHLLLMRHADAPGYGDPPGFMQGDCSTQRNLGEAGREQARAIGRWLQAQGVQRAQVFSSPWCRCLETARLLGFGAVSVEESLGSFHGRSELGPERTGQLQQFVARTLAGPMDRALILVTHQVNISSYVGGAVASGEMVLVRADARGRPNEPQRYAPPPVAR